MIRAAVFDLDGVVLDSMSIWKDLGARYLLRRGLTPEPGLGELLFAMSMEQGADYLRTHYPLPESADVLADLSAMLRDYYYNEVPEKDGAREALAFLQGRGVAVTAATSSPRTHVTRALERLGLLPYFRAIYTTGELGVSKHRPDIYHLAAQGVPPRAVPGGGGLPLCPANRRRGGLSHRGHFRRQRRGGSAGPAECGGGISHLPGPAPRPLGAAE